MYSDATQYNVKYRNVDKTKDQRPGKYERYDEVSSYWSEEYRSLRRGLRIRYKVSLIQRSTVRDLFGNVFLPKPLICDSYARSDFNIKWDMGVYNEAL